MPLFSILVSELTPQLLAKAEYWRLYLSDFANAAKATYWAEVVHHTELHCAPDGGVYIGPVDLGDYVAGAHMCFPVSISPDGTEARLEMPQMPDEVEIEGIPPEWAIDEPDPDLPNRVYWVLDSAVRWRIAPTPEHYPRWTCDGVWVWSTRR